MPLNGPALGSGSRGSAVTSRLVVACGSAVWAVRSARSIGEAHARSNAAPVSESAGRSACATPTGVSGTSVWVAIRSSTFHRGLPVADDQQTMLERHHRRREAPYPGNPRRAARAWRTSSLSVAGPGPVLRARYSVRRAAPARPPGRPRTARSRGRRPRSCPRPPRPPPPATQPSDPLCARRRLRLSGRARNLGNEATRPSPGTRTARSARGRPAARNHSRAGE
jgi:hypothetical protein